MFTMRGVYAMAFMAYSGWPEHSGSDVSVLLLMISVLIDDPYITSSCWVLLFLLSFLSFLLEQVRDLTQRLAKTSEGKTVAEDQCRELKDLASSLDTELKDARTSLGASEKELAEVKDKVSCVEFFWYIPMVVGYEKYKNTSICFVFVWVCEIDGYVPIFLLNTILHTFLLTSYCVCAGWLLEVEKSYSPL